MQQIIHNNFRTLFIFLVICFGICATEIFSQPQPAHRTELAEDQPTDSIRMDSAVTFYKEEMIDSLILFGKQYLGLAYRYGGTTPAGFDCSGYVSYLFKNFGYKLPTSSSAMAYVGDAIDYQDARKGDLLLFKGRNAASTSVGHVALIIDRDSLGVTMMHSCHRGVKIDRYPQMDYYRARFVGVRRVKL